MTPDALWNRYAKIWSAKPELRVDELNACLADEATYCDPNGLIKGRAALSTYMGEFQQQAAGSKFRILDVSHHNNRTLVRWVLEGADGAVLQTGTSFAELSHDGRLQAITGFFHALASQRRS
jgi:SnoaL-like domain